MDPREAQAQAETAVLQARQKKELIWRAIIRAVATVLAFVGIGLQVRVVVSYLRWDSDYYYSYSYSYSYNSAGDYWVSPESFTFLVLAVVWNIAESITVCVNKRGIHPGAHVALDLIIWMGLFSAGIVQVLINYWSALTISAGVIKLICSLLHFILFVWACINTDRRRKASSAKLIAQITSSMQQQQKPQTQQQSIPSANAAGGPVVPPGMVLVPIQQLAQLNPPQPAYRPYSMGPNLAGPELYQQPQPYTPTSAQHPVASPVSEGQAPSRHTSPASEPAAIAVPPPLHANGENIAELRAAPGVP